MLNQYFKECHIAMQCRTSGKKCPFSNMCDRDDKGTYSECGRYCNEKREAEVYVPETKRNTERGGNAIH